MENKNLNYQKLLYDFITGKTDFDEFMPCFQDNFDAILAMIQAKVDSLNDVQLQNFINEYSKPVFAEIKFFNEEFEMDVQQRAKLLKSYGRQVPANLYENHILNQAIEENQNEILKGYKDVRSMILDIVGDRSYCEIYGGMATFFVRDRLFDTIAKLYDALYGVIPSKNYEYKVKKSLIIDTDLDKIACVNDGEIDCIIEEKIFKPTSELTRGKNPDLATYQERLKRVKMLIKSVFGNAEKQDALNMEEA